MEHPFLKKIHQRAAAGNKTIAFPESWDPRILEAAYQLKRDKVVEPLLIGKEDEIQKLAKEKNIRLEGVSIYDTVKNEKEVKDLAYALYELRKEKGMSIHEATKTLERTLYVSTMLLKQNKIHGVVTGSMSPTADVIRAAGLIIKCLPGIGKASGAMIMASSKKELGSDGLFIFADVAVQEQPTAEELGQIAVASAGTAKALLGVEPIVAMLSFSTKGSAKHKDIDKVLEAMAIAKKLDPNLIIDGEMQLDAAIIPSVGQSKAKGSPVAGKANVLVFPDLDAGNIGYKLTQRFGDAIAAGPVLQGFKAPLNDLSRGCLVEDIYHTAAITACQAMMK